MKYGFPSRLLPFERARNTFGPLGIRAYVHNAALFSRDCTRLHKICCMNWTDTHGRYEVGLARATSLFSATVNTECKSETRGLNLLLMPIIIHVQI